MPLTFVVGIYGMNFDYMPELHTRWGYPTLIVVMVLISAIIYTWFRRKKWL
jgi:magnesium transporter